MTHILSKRDQSAVIRYAMDRIDEALAQAWMRDFCKVNSFSVPDIRWGNQRPDTMDQRIKVAIHLSSKGFKRALIAKVMNRHYDMIRYYTKPALRERKRVKNRLNAERWRDSPKIKVNVQLTVAPDRALY